VLFAGRFDIHTNNAAARTEILFPHGKRAAARNANLDHDWGPAAESLKMTFVNIEIVHPLVQTLAAIVQKISVQKSVAHETPLSGD
jgi:hypothetical protein